MAKQLRGGRRQAIGPDHARLLSPPHKQPSMEEEWRGHKQKKEFWLPVGRRGRDMEWMGAEAQKEEEKRRGGERRQHDGIQVPQWQIESFEEPKQGSRLNTKTFHRGSAATEKQLQSLSFEAPAIYGDFNCLCKSGSNWKPRQYRRG